MLGFMHDFEALPGAAHFLEHMLFMGSKKYPQEDYYHKFIDEHAGVWNGSTSEYYQSYYWSVSCDAFQDTLDMYVIFNTNKHAILIANTHTITIQSA